MTRVSRALQRHDLSRDGTNFVASHLEVRIRSPVRPVFLIEVFQRILNRYSHGQSYHCTYHVTRSNVQLHEATCQRYLPKHQKPMVGCNKSGARTAWADVLYSLDGRRIRFSFITHNLSADVIARVHKLPALTQCGVLSLAWCVMGGEDTDISSLVQVQWCHSLGIALVQTTCIIAAGNEKATKSALCS